MRTAVVTDISDAVHSTSGSEAWKRMATLAAVLAVSTWVGFGWMLPSAKVGAPGSGVHHGIPVQSAALLDRGAERQPSPSPREGGPGGQLGDGQ